MKKLNCLLIYIKSVLIKNKCKCKYNSETIKEDYKYLVQKDKLKYETEMSKIERTYIDTKSRLDEQNNNYNNINSCSPSLIAGDIVITNGTSFFGVAGHTGIFIAPNKILHISSYFNNPEVITVDEWVSRYNQSSYDYSDVYRPNFYTKYGVNASKWAKKMYENSKANYSLILDRSSTDPIYCSLIPWQGYKYGLGDFAVNSTATFGIITPYSLKREIKNNKYIGSLK